MLSVEDWAEIRRLHRSERMPIKGIARVMGIKQEHGEGAGVQPGARGLNLRRYSCATNDGSARVIGAGVLLSTWIQYLPSNESFWLTDVAIRDQLDGTYGAGNRAGRRPTIRQARARDCRLGRQRR